MEDKAIQVQQTPQGEFIFLVHGDTDTLTLRLSDEDARELWHKLGELLQQVTDGG